MPAAKGAPEALLGAGGEPLVYPTPLFIRNTFIDCDEARPHSFEDFYEERLVASCPASKLEEPGYQGETPENADVAFVPAAPRPSAWEAVQNAWAAVRANGRKQREASRRVAKACTPERESSSTPNSDASVSTAATGATLEGVAAALAASASSNSSLPRATAEVAAPSAGLQLTAAAFAPEAPSLGSEGHYMGNCKPCAFVNSKGCKSGYQCQFCHLCDAGEKKRRQKEKRAFFATMRSMAGASTTGEGWAAPEAAGGRGSPA